MKLVFLANFLKILKYKLHENPFIGSRVVPGVRADGRAGGGRTDRHNEANSRFSKICERA